MGLAPKNLIPTDKCAYRALECCVSLVFLSQGDLSVSLCEIQACMVTGVGDNGSPDVMYW